MLPEKFQLTQSNLQDYLTCPQRFELKYLKKLNWPAVETAPVQAAEARMQLGSDFHRLVQQHAMGIPAASLTAATAQHPELAAMWHNYLTHKPPELDLPGAKLFPEVTLSTVLNGYRLVAKYDLIALLPGSGGKILVVDWKTNTRRPTSAVLQERVQSRIYPLVLVKAGQSITGSPVNPDDLTMQYWFAHEPTHPETIVYSQNRLAQDEAYLQTLIREVDTATDFPLTANQKACRFCVFRSFCDRGALAGLLDDNEEELLSQEIEPDDWAQITEIAY